MAVVGYQELALATRLAGASTKQYFLFFLAAALLYLAITLVSNLVFSLIERRVRVSTVPVLPWNVIGWAMRVLPDAIYDRVMRTQVKR